MFLLTQLYLSSLCAKVRERAILDALEQIRRQKQDLFIP